MHVYYNTKVYAFWSYYFVQLIALLLSFTFILPCQKFIFK